MKKIISLLLAVVCLLSLAACGKDKGISIQSPNGFVSDTDSGSKPSSGKNQKVEVAETVLYHDHGVKITATGLDMDAFMGPELKLTIENNSGQDLTVQAREVAVNGFLVDTIMSVDVVNGKIANDSLTFMDSSLEMCGIDTLAVLEFYFTMFDSDSWENYVDTEMITLTTSAANGAVQSPVHTGQVVYEANDIKIVAKGLSEDADILGTSIVLYMENNSDSGIIVQTEDTSINGIMVDAIFSSELPAGKRTVDTITFLSSDLEENGITDVENVELIFNIIDADSWYTIEDTDTIRLEF